MTEKEALQAAESLRKWCRGKPCEQCVFQGDNCGIGSRIPAKWTIPKRRRWSDADVALASALIKNGYEMISSVNDWAFSIIGKNVDAICLSNGVIFKPFKVGEIVMLEDIVKEGEQK